MIVNYLNYAQDWPVEELEAENGMGKNWVNRVAQTFSYQQKQWALFHLNDHIAASALHIYLITGPQMAATIVFQQLSINLHQSHHTYLQKRLTPNQQSNIKPGINHCLRLMPPCIILVHGRPTKIATSYLAACTHCSNRESIWCPSYAWTVNNFSTWMFTE
jgi:hypothetical protein